MLNIVRNCIRTQHLRGCFSVLLGAQKVTMLAQPKQQLLFLKKLLLNLPNSLPSPSVANSEFRALTAFELDPNVLKRTQGDELLAVSESLAAIFIADGHVLISERGTAVCAVVDVLGSYLEKFLDSPQIVNWIATLTRAARQLYVDFNQPVSP